VTIALGASGVASTNSGNTNAFDTDKSFLAVGDNNAEHKWTLNGAPTDRQVLMKQWKVQWTGGASQPLITITAPDSNSTTSTGRLATTVTQIYLLTDAD